MAHEPAGLRCFCWPTKKAPSRCPSGDCLCPAPLLPTAQAACGLFPGLITGNFLHLRLTNWLCALLCQEDGAPLGLWRQKFPLFWRCYKCYMSLQSLFQAQMMLALLSYPQWTESIQNIWFPLPFFLLSVYPHRVEVVFPRAKSALCVIIDELFSCHSSPFPISSVVSVPFLLRNFLDARYPAKCWHFKRCCKRPEQGIFNFSKQFCLQGLTVGAVLGKTLN